MNIQVFDIIIIGGGFAGSALAYQFSKNKLSTLLIESGDICSGTSAACAGRAQIFDSETPEYLNIVHQGYSKLPDLGKELEIDLEWETPGHITLYSSEKLLSDQTEKISWLRNLGLHAELLDPETTRKIEPLLDMENFIGAIYAEEGHLNPFKFCWGYISAAQKRGVIIEHHTKVNGLILDKNKVLGVQTSKQKHYGKTIVLATGAWSASFLRPYGIDIPISFTKAEAMVSEPLPRIFNHHIGTSGFYESVHGDNRSVTLGLGQHKNGCLLISNAIQPAQEIHRESSAWGMPTINQQMTQFFPSLSEIRIVRTWSAPSPFSEDFHPVVGWLPQYDNLYLASAFHLAIPTIPIMSEKIADHILGRNQEPTKKFLEPFSPQRFSKM